MKMRHMTAAALLTVLFAPAAMARIGDYGEPVFARNAFGLLTTDLRMPVSSQVTKFGVNSANNVFFSADGGIGAVRIEENNITRFSTSFPINRSSYPSDYLLSNDLSAIVFAEFNNDEFFFFSSDDVAGNAGLQYGRYTDRVDLRDLIELDGQTEVEVHDLATDGADRLWVSTENGVYEIDLTEGETPQPTITSPYTVPTDNIRTSEIVDASPITGEPSAIFYTMWNGTQDETGKNLYYLNPSESPAPQPIGMPFNDARIGGMKVVGDELYVVQLAPSDTPTDELRKRTIVKYAFSGGEWTRIWVADFLPDLGLYSDSNYLVYDIDVSPSDGVIWLGTSGYAFFQTPGSGLFDQRVCRPGNWEDPSDDYYSSEDAADCTTPGSGWRHIMKRSSSEEGVSNEAFQDYEALLVDRGENVWLGSDVGVRGFIARFLALNSTRYIGIDRTATVTLDDVDPGTEGFLKISVGTESASVNVVFDEDNHMVPVTFGFTYSDVDPSVTPTPDPLLFTVTSTSDGVPIEVEYFRSAADGSPVLSALASWAEIVDFEDDVFIGGPCFLDAIIRWGE